MAALDDVKTQATGQLTAGGLTLTPAMWEDIKPFIALFFWNWYHDHKHTILLRAGWLFVHFTVRVQDLNNLFETLFGKDPGTAPPASE
jgi:hypothetical protein